MPKDKQEPDQIDRARAARALIDSRSQHKQEELGLRAFMAIFHPDVAEAEIKEMLRKD